MKTGYNLCKVYNNTESYDIDSIDLFNGLDINICAEVIKPLIVTSFETGKVKLILNGTVISQGQWMI